MRLLIVDHRDSFTYNLVDAFRGLGGEVAVCPSPSLEGRGLGGGWNWNALVFSPGPGRPEHYPQTTALLHRLPATLPVLGVCLGMQILNEWSGGATVHAPTLVHGKTSRVTHSGQGIFAGLDSPCTVARYHSLACQVRSADWEIAAWSSDDVPMAIRHRSRPWWGLQFHPESFMTPEGLAMLKNWMTTI